MYLILKKTAYYSIAFLFILSINILNAQNDNIEISYKVNNDNSVDITYKKRLPGSYYVTLKFSKLTNSYPSDFKGVINKSSGSIVKLRPINKEKSIGFSYKTSYRRGAPDPKIDSLVTYALPFKKDKKITVYEAFNVSEKYLNEERPSNWKSYVVKSKTPDTIFSMRKGTVIEIVNDFVTDTIVDKSFTSNRNRVIVEHEDGTYASYKGFKKNSISVKLGQTVYPYTKLGVMDILNTDGYRCSFTVYYVKDSETFEYEYITPNFLTENGIEKLITAKEYQVKFNETVLLQEFTRREKKKYKKDPSQFN